MTPTARTSQLYTFEVGPEPLLAVLIEMSFGIWRDPGLMAAYDHSRAYNPINTLKYIYEYGVVPMSALTTTQLARA
jgi:hypothetical protein